MSFQPPLRITEWMNVRRGPVALLGSGRSILDVDLEDVARQMPTFGINRSWQLIESEFRCWVDEAHDLEIQRGQAPRPRVAFWPDSRRMRRIQAQPRPPVLDGDGEWCVYVGVHVRPRNGEPVGFFGDALDVGSHCAFAGLLALELVKWIGFEEIHLFGFDADGARFFDPPDAAGIGDEERTMMVMAFRQVRQMSLAPKFPRIINHSSSPAIDAFPIVSWEDWKRRR